MPEDTPVLMPLFTKDELKQFRYKCSHKLAVSLTVGAIYLLGMTVFFVNKAAHNAAGQDKLQYYGFAAAGYVVIVGLVAMIVRRSQSLNFSRFLQGCVRFDNFGYMLEYVELRMPEPFSPRFLKYPVHLMILGKERYTAERARKISDAVVKEAELTDDEILHCLLLKDRKLSEERLATIQDVQMRYLTTSSLDGIPPETVSEIQKELQVITGFESAQ